MGSKTSTQTQASSTSSAPWAPAQAGLKDILNRASTLGNDQSVWRPTFSENTTGGVAALGALGTGPQWSADTMRGVAGHATAGMGTGTDQMTATARGDYLNANPYLDAVINRSMGNTADKVNAQFSAAGRYGSGAHTGVLTQELGGIDAQARLANYGQERSNQLAAAQGLGALGMEGARLAPAADTAAAQQIGYQLSAGQMQDEMDQQLRMSPVQAAEWQAGITRPIAGLGGTSNTTGTTTMVQQPNRGQQILGGIMMGGSLLAAPYTGGQSLSMFGRGAGMMGV
ncbi:MAG: hypothetical protein IT537_25340 [Hyphomicrobiales bacterium]|nr:hypothetical protein [Hyphomicrobiales bacterium]